MRLPLAGWVLTLCTALGACANSGPDRPPTAPHHRSGGFQNNYIDFQPKGLGDLLRWRWSAWRGNLPPAPSTPIPTVRPDLTALRSNAKAGAAMRPGVTWLGHASTLAQLGGLNVLLDPIFSDRASPVGFIGPRRHQPPPVALADLPHVDVVLISHNHYDHLDAASVKGLAGQPGGAPLFVVPLGLKRWFADQGIARVVELDWWESHALPVPAGLPPVDVVLTPAQHWSGRGLGDRLQTLWAGFAIFAPDCHLFFAGDTGYSKDFADMRARFASRQTAELGGGFDIALLPVGAYEPRWFMREQHVNPAEAVQIHLDLGSKRSMGVHWGTFELTDEPLDEPPRALAAAKRSRGVPDDDFFVLAVGETRWLPRRSAPGAKEPAR